MFYIKKTKGTIFLKFLKRNIDKHHDYWHTYIM